MEMTRNIIEEAIMATMDEETGKKFGSINDIFIIEQ